MLHCGSSTRQSFAVALLFALGLLISGRPSTRASCWLPSRMRPTPRPGTSVGFAPASAAALVARLAAPIGQNCLSSSPASAARTTAIES